MRERPSVRTWLWTRHPSSLSGQLREILEQRAGADHLRDRVLEFVLGSVAGAGFRPLREKIGDVVRASELERRRCGRSQASADRGAPLVRRPVLLAARPKPPLALPPAPVAASSGVTREAENSGSVPARMARIGERIRQQPTPGPRRWWPRSCERGTEHRDTSWWKTHWQPVSGEVARCRRAY